MEMVDMRRRYLDGRARPRKVVAVVRPLWLPGEDDMRELRVAQVLAAAACGMAVLAAALGIACAVLGMVS